MASPLRALVWNDRERRPRALWRLSLAAVVVVAAGVGVGLVGDALAALVPGSDPSAVAVARTVPQVTLLAGFAGGILAAAALVDRRRLRDLGLARSRDWWTDLGFGVVLGVALPAVVFALELALGYVAVTGTVVAREGPALPPVAGAPFAVAFALVAVNFAAVAVFEELLFRGYLLVNVAEGLQWGGRLGARGALAGAALVTSVAFGLGHAANPNATLRGVVLIALYGALLAAGYLLTDRLAVPVGLHFGWNLSVSSVFGFPVSGVATPVTLVAVEQTGPVLVTGGRFGPEAGLVSLVSLAAGVGALLAWVRWREGVVRVRESVVAPDLRADDSEDADAE